MLRYQALESVNSIRVIVLHCGSRGQRIECYLRQIALGDQAPEYEALSYEWQPPGSDSALCDIIVNGSVVAIQPNLYDALQHLRQETQRRVLWIDALCINQSELEERNHQVHLMGKIYSGAFSVLAWTGPADKDSDDALDLVTELGPHLESHTGFPRGSRKYGPSNLKAYNPSLDEDAIYISLDPPSGDTFLIEGFGFRAFVSWSNRSYWLRLWIIQELYLSRDLWIYAGDRRVAGEHVSLVAQHLQKSTRGLTSIARPGIQCRGPAFSLMASFWQRDGLSLPQLLTIFHDSLCSERHDVIFGLLGIASDSELLRESCRENGAMVWPDYSIGVAQLYRYILAAYAPLDRTVFSKLTVTRLRIRLGLSYEEAREIDKSLGHPFNLR